MIIFSLIYFRISMFCFNINISVMLNDQLYFTHILIYFHKSYLKHKSSHLHLIRFVCIKSHLEIVFDVNTKLVRLVFKHLTQILFSSKNI